MPRASWLPDVLRAAGLKVALEPGWEARGAATFTPRGVMVHHTAGGKGEAPSLRICRDGRPDLPGPLCQLLLGRSGTFYVLASGRANHAGAGEWAGVTSGNTSFIGIECENSGTPTDPWPAIQLDAMHRGCAALIEYMGVGSDMVCFHREYARPRGRKPDPHSLDGGAFRAEVDRIARGEVPRPVPIPAMDTVTSRPTLRRGDSGAHVEALQRAISAAVDGDFGPRTEAALRAFQRNHGLVPDGIAGPRSWGVIASLAAA